MATIAEIVQARQEEQMRQLNAGREKNVRPKHRANRKPAPGGTRQPEQEKPRER